MDTEEIVNGVDLPDDDIVDSSAEDLADIKIDYDEGDPDVEDQSDED